MKQDKEWKRLLPKLALIIPLILGTAGFLLEGTPLLDALFTAVTLYAMEYGDGQNHLLVEIARWTAPLATAGGVLMMVSVLRQKINNYMLYLRGNSTAVYGPAVAKAAVLQELGDTGIDGGERFVRAQRYILLDEEQENLRFYCRHYEKLKDSTVYLMTDSFPAQTTAGANLRLFCPEETAARLFWKKHCLYERSVEKNHRMDIVLIGFGRLGEELLTTGLQSNIFHPGQSIAYHIFGEEQGFRAIHSRLSKIHDPVKFYAEPWYEKLDLLEQADMVIVAEQNEQLSLLRKLQLATIAPELYVFAADAIGEEILVRQDRLHVFHWRREANRPEHIFEGPLGELAKQLNLMYVCREKGIPPTEETMQAEWNALDAFTRYSNISAADYHQVQRRILAVAQLPVDYDVLPTEWQELLAELEHIRWCRYHYLNNWKYGVPADGNNKDMRHRIHEDLRPYGELTETEKEKDRDLVRLMCTLEAR